MTQIWQSSRWNGWNSITPESPSTLPFPMLWFIFMHILNGQIPSDSQVLYCSQKWFWLGNRALAQMLMLFRYLKWGVIDNNFIILWLIAGTTHPAFVCDEILMKQLSSYAMVCVYLLCYITTLHVKHWSIILCNSVVSCQQFPFGCCWCREMIWYPNGCLSPPQMKSTEVDQGLFTDSYCKVCSAQLISESQRVAHYEVRKTTCSLLWGSLTPPPTHTHTPSLGYLRKTSSNTPSVN